ncbi:MAG: cytochrome c peroxidase [Desulforhabdus sp.]|jgi:cytochrome c peroxidase|nr:cytochrome c peroxidase [Desulforhabdus sp.]
MWCKKLCLVLAMAMALALSSAVLAQPLPMNLNAEQELGRMLFMEKDLSINKNQACASCHFPGAGFDEPDDTLPVSKGSVSNLFGGRNAPSAGYAAFSPFFRWDDADGLYVGGQFWDGRANSLSEQAAGPLLNPVEMAMPDKWSVVDRLRTSSVNPSFPPPPAFPFKWSNYVDAFKEVYNLDLASVPAYDPAYDGSSPMPPGVLEVYDRIAKAIGELEKSRTFSRFTSKYDYYLAGMVKLTHQEQMGLKLFETKAKCAQCHLNRPALAPDGNAMPPLFTDYTYDNLGLPINPKVVELRSAAGLPVPTDYGLGGRPDIAARDPLTLPDGTIVSTHQAGKHRVMTLRNIDITKPYGHNGLFETLEQIVHFYNTRDVLPACAGPLYNTDPDFGNACWPAPEVDMNVNAGELGKLNLTPDQEGAVVAFLKTLTDGYVVVDPKTGMPRPSPWFPKYPPVTPVPMP